MFCDFHTHRAGHPDGIAALVSVPHPVAGLRFTSLELHPWYLSGETSGLPDGFERELKACTALGEAGLDRLRGPALPGQRNILHHALDAAQRFEKPVVIHVVRSYPELFAELKDFSGLRILIHGFRGSAAKLEDLRARGFWISLDRRLLDDRNMLEYLKNDDFSRLGFESDDGNEPVSSIIRRAGEALQRQDLPGVTAANFLEFIGYDHL